MAQQWGTQGQPGFQYPMQTGFQPNPAQFQSLLGGGMAPQPTGFPGQRPPFQQPQQTGFPGMGGLQSQPTGFPTGGMGFQQQQQQQQPPPPVPPVPPLPGNLGGPGFGGMNASSGFGATQQHRPPPPPPPQPHRSFLGGPPSGFGGAGSGLAPQMTGFPGASPLLPQMTGYVDPRLQMMSSTFMPANPSMPFQGGVPQFAGLPSTAPPAASLQQSIQQYNQQASTPAPKMSWALSKAEKKNYDQIFRAWDTQGTGYISGQTALEVFGQSGLDKNSLAKIWALADADNKGKLNLAEFHVAMGLIYRKLNGMEVPDQLPPELVPPSARNLDESVDFLKNLLDRDPPRPSSAASGDLYSKAKARSLYDTSVPGAGGRKDGTVYKHSDDSDTGSYYKSRSRHLDRRDVRVGNESPGDDLESLRRKVESLQTTLERSDEESRNRTREDEELEREMDDLRYRVKRVQEDLEYVSRGPRSPAKDDERRRLERDLMHLMHERIPEVQRKQEERERRREQEKREWARERDRHNDRSGRYDDRDRDRDHDRDRDRGHRSYSPSYDRDLPRDKDDYGRSWDRDRDLDRDRDWDRDREKDYGRYDRDRDRERDGDRDGYGRDRQRSPPARSPPPPPPPVEAPIATRPPPAPKPSATPSRPLTKEELREQAQRRVQERMRALGVITPGPSEAPTSPAVDTSVEERLAREKREAEEKARQAEKELEERERARREKLESEKALKEGKSATPAPAAQATSTSPPRVPVGARAAPPPTPKRAPAPPPPAKRGQAFRASATAAAPPPPAPPAAPAVPEVDPEEHAFREREERLRKQREERAARLRQLEKEEEEMRRAEEEYEKRRKEFMMGAAKTSSVPSTPVQRPAPPAHPASVPPPPAPPVAVSPAPPPPPPAPLASSLTTTPSAPATSPGEKLTNPFSKLMNQGNGSAAIPTPPSSTGGTNPFFKPPQAPAAPAAPPPPAVLPPVSKSPAPPVVKTNYNTVPQDEDDWGDVQEQEEDDSSDDEITSSRNARDMLARQLFGGNRPQSATGSRPSTPAPVSAPPAPAPTIPPPAPPPPPPATAPVSPMFPAVGTVGSAPAFVPPPPPPPAAPPAPAAAAAGDRNALLSSIVAGKKLRKAVTNDRSAAPVSGRVLGDTAPPEHINTVPRPASPPAPRAPEVAQTSQEDLSHHRGASVDWYAGLAAEQAPVSAQAPPTTVQEPEKPASSIPAIQVEAPTEAAVPDAMDDVDKSKEYRVRTLYPYEAQRPEDLSFSENVVIIANPSKSGGAWWYGVTVRGGKSGFFPSTYVQEMENMKAKAVYSYSGGNPDELPFAEGDTLTIVDRSEADWWKTEQGGVIFIVPASYLEIVEGRSDGPRSTVDENESIDLADHVHGTHHAAAVIEPSTAQRHSRSANSPLTMHIPGDFHLDADSDNEDSAGAGSSEDEYHSFESESESEDNGSGSDGGVRTEEEKRKEHEAREWERQRVLEAAGLLVKTSSIDLASAEGEGREGPGKIGRWRSTTARRRRPPPKTPNINRNNGGNRLSVASLPSSFSLSSDRDRDKEKEKELLEMPTSPSISVLHIDDAFERYEQYRLSKNYRLSVSSIDTTGFGGPPSPSASPAPSLNLPPSVSATPSKDGSDSSRNHSHIFKFLSRSKTPEPEAERPRIRISGPISNLTASGSGGGGGSADDADLGAAFGSSWASLLGKDALESIPPLERKRQEAIFELINTEAAYVRDLQLIVEVFYSSMVSMLDEKETTVVFANIEDLLLVNTTFLSSLEERQKDCRLYIDTIGDLLQQYMANMNVYENYCINQANAIKILQSIRDRRPDVAVHLQKLREDPSVRNLDLSSYLLAPMQRITRYPLLMRQVLNHCEDQDECRRIKRALDSVERVLSDINEAIREQECRTRLEAVSRNLYVGQGRLNLARSTSYMGPRKLLKEGTLAKHKSGRKLRVFLCNDLIVLTDESVSRLYKMPIQLNQVEVKEISARDETGFKLEFHYPRGGEAMAFRAGSAKECQEWMKEIREACRRARKLEREVARAAAGRQ